MKKKVDNRVRTLLENGVKTGHRSMFLIVGDHGKDQIVNLHYILSKACVKSRPSVLWCYKNDLGFSSHRKKRVKQIKKMQQRGLLDPEKDDPFELFVASTKIRYCYYKETHKILGNTFGMCVLQDFEALTPNIMARTIETVEGGGAIVILLKTMSSLKQLYAMTMDVHSRFRTEAHQDVVARFNERFILSLASCTSCIAMDDELNILPITKSIARIQPIRQEITDGSAYVTAEQQELVDLKKSLQDTQPVGCLVETARTVDQAKAVLTFTEAISEKTLRSTVALTAGRGRGKSASLGVAIAAAVAYGYSNIFVTSPTPENLNTLFEFVFKGFDALQYKRHMDYEAIESTNPDFNGAVVRVNIFRDHRQTIQYIMPQDHAKLAQAELLVIDEAAAIPLPLVKQLLGPYLVFMSSTVNGYEGTGRSLSLKLIQSLRTQSGGASNASNSSRTLREVTLEEPIRYSKGDPVEAWLNQLLCLDASTTSITASHCPPPAQCELYHINRDTLFSYHQASESFLSKMMALYVASHYRNTPNDLQMMSDAPAHEMFALLGPIDAKSRSLPDILCVVQVCFEGEISRESVQRQLARGQRAAGDLIPWTIAQQYQDNEFAHLSGARIVRIATHPDMTRMGYGSRAIELLTKYFDGEFCALSDGPAKSGGLNEGEGAEEGDGLTEEKLAPRNSVKQLLTRLTDRPAERLNWLGVSYGVTQQLYGFWKRAGFVPMYMRQTCNELTGEHTCIMLRTMRSDQAESSWLNKLYSDFHRRWLALLGYEFRNFSVALALEVLKAPAGAESEAVPLSDTELGFYFTPYDLKRLESYSNNLVDYHMITDLIPHIARIYFEHKSPTVHLSHAQSAILCLLGLQHQTMEHRTGELSELKDNQFLALFNKTVRKMSEFFRTMVEKRVDSQLGAKRRGESRILEESQPLDKGLDEELRENVEQVTEELREKQEKMIQELDLSRYAIDKNDVAWDEALGDAKSVPGAVSVKSKSGEKHKRTGSDKAKRRESSDGKRKKPRKGK
eukprot:TRINITY_DN1625_c0_g2_i2.p1 TRINITY_DN1625_c0_g2~~TRINITY_DN1625_c0_g2_i2.p1  ORF type:complete len:1018 (+),score=296.10 TRINITY_DN1625_c0_g2_i2:224-3277(+)